MIRSCGCILWRTDITYCYIVILYVALNHHPLLYHYNIKCSFDIVFWSSFICSFNLLLWFVWPLETLHHLSWVWLPSAGSEFILWLCSMNWDLTQHLLLDLLAVWPKQFVSCFPHSVRAVFTPDIFWSRSILDLQHVQISQAIQVTTGSRDAYTHPVMAPSSFWFCVKPRQEHAVSYPGEGFSVPELYVMTLTYTSLTIPFFTVLTLMTLASLNWSLRAFWSATQMTDTFLCAVHYLVLTNVVLLIGSIFSRNSQVLFGWLLICCKSNLQSQWSSDLL